MPKIIRRLSCLRAGIGCGLSSIQTTALLSSGCKSTARLSQVTGWGCLEIMAGCKSGRPQPSPKADQIKEVTVRTRCTRLQLGSVLCALVMACALCIAQGQEPVRSEVAAQEVSLLSQNRYQDFAKANFNFKLGVRGDSVS